MRIEQIHPLPVEQMRAVIKKYGKAERYLWVQEEPLNMGAWSYIAMHFNDVKWQVLARPASGAPATGSSKRSAKQQAEIIEKAFAPFVAKQKKPTTAKARA